MFLARAGMVADFIQPGLIQLQPNLEDFMDTLEPLQGMLCKNTHGKGFVKTRKGRFYIFIFLYKKTHTQIPPLLFCIHCHFILFLQK